MVDDYNDLEKTKEVAAGRLAVQLLREKDSKEIGLEKDQKS